MAHDLSPWGMYKNADVVVKAVMIGLAIASIPFGALLGVFLLGVTTRRVGESHAFGGMLAGFAMITFVRFGTTIAWTWYVLVGSIVTVVVALASARLRPQPVVGIAS